MNKRDTESKESLLLHFFSDETSNIENEQIQEWLNESEKNKRLAADIYNIYFAAKSLNTIQSINSKYALEKVNKKIFKNNTSRWILNIQKVASILLIPVLAISIYYYFIQQKDIKYIDIKTTPGMVASFDLPDGTHVWLNSGSQLIYPNHFSQKERKVLLDGEAYFKVKANHQSKFIASTKKNLDIEVCGTEFNLEAYSSDSTVSTILINGNINLLYKDSYGVTNTIPVLPEQKVIYNYNHKTIRQKNAYSMGEITWKDGLIVLKNTSLEDVVKILSKRFNVEFKVKNDALKDNYFTGTFDTQHLNKILDHIRISSNIKYRIIQSPANKTNDVHPKDIVELY